MTPVQNRLDCSENDCAKTFANKRNLTKHKDKFHMIVNAVSKSPIVSTVRTLFSGENKKDLASPSTQGASDGSINSPKVVSGGFYQCNECTYEFTIKEELVKHKIEKHEKAKVAESENNDIATCDTGSAEELVQLLEMDDMAMDKVLAEKAAVDKIVNSFVNNAFRVMNPEEETSNSDCHNCNLKDEVIANYGRSIDDKNTVIDEKTATVNGLMQRVKKLEEEKTLLKKKADQTDKLKETLSTKNKEISNLQVQICTKDQLLAHAKQAAETVQTVPEQEITIVDNVVKKCKKCTFTAPNMKVLGLHMENDHQYEFECIECGNKFPFKNQLKLHRREVHEEGTFVCFVCNEKFKTYKQLKAHIQKKCKSQSIPKQTQKDSIVHRHNEDILPEDEHKCPKCPKITNNQVSLVNHINTVHNVTKEKCDTCGLEFTKRELLVKHIMENHTNVNIQQKVVQGHQHQQNGLTQHQQQDQWLPRIKCQHCQYETNSDNELEFHVESMHQQINASQWCYRCNVEVNQYSTNGRHMCRMPNYDDQNTCNFCKIELIGIEAKKNHICEHHQFKTVSYQKREKRRLETECKNGAGCWRAAFNKCWFKHSQQVNMLPHREQRTRVEAKPQLYCMYQDRCFKGKEICRFIHFNQGFQTPNQSQTNQ